MQFCLGVIPQPPGAIQTPLIFLMHFTVTNVYISLSVLLLSQNNQNRQIWHLETQTFPMICILSRL